MNERIRVERDGHQQVLADVLYGESVKLEFVWTPDAGWEFWQTVIDGDGMGGFSSALEGRKLKDGPLRARLDIQSAELRDRIAA